MKNMWNRLAEFLKSHVKTVIIAAVSLVLLVAAILTICLVKPGEEESFIDNTLDSLFVDGEALLKAAERLDRRGFKSHLSLTLPSEITQYDGEIAFTSDTLGYNNGKNPRARTDNTITIGEEKFAFSIGEDKEGVYLYGKDKSGDDISLFVPRDNLKENIDSSVFSPDSESRFAMSQEVYDAVLKVLEQGEDSIDRELLEFLSDIDERISPLFEEKVEKRSIEGTRHYETITSGRLDSENLALIFDIVKEELKEREDILEKLSLTIEQIDSSVDSLKEILKGLSLEYSYTVSKNRLINLHIFVTNEDKTETLDINLDVVYEAKRCAFTLTVIGDSYVYNSRTTDKLTVNYEKLQNGKSTDIKLEVVVEEATKPVNKMKAIFTHDKKTDDYRFAFSTYEEKKYKEKFSLEGKLEIYNFGKGFSFTLDKFTMEEKEYSDLLSFEIKKSGKSRWMKLDSADNLFKMSEEEIDQLIFAIPTDKIGDIYKSITNQELPMTKDGYLILSSEIIEPLNNVVERYYYYLTSSSHNGDPVGKVYYYFEESDFYALITYDKTSRKVEVALYKYPGDLLNEYHYLSIMNGSAMSHQYQVVEEKPSTCTKQGSITEECITCKKQKTTKLDCLPHEYELVSEVFADCDNSGSVTEKCRVCDYTHTRTTNERLGHLEEYVTISASENPGMLGDAILTCCERCNVLLSVNYGESIIWHFSGNSAYPDDSTKHFILPDKISAYINISSVKVNLSNANYSLISVRVPNGCKVIKNQAFSVAQNLQVIVIPSSVTEIQDGAFSSEPPSTIYYLGTEEQWSEVKLNSYTEIWSNSHIVFLPEGIDDADIISRCVDDSDLSNVLDEKKTLTESIDATENLADSNDSVSMIYNGRVELVAYDALTDTLSIAEVGESSTTIILMSSDGQVKTTFEIADVISIMGSDNGLLAMASSSLGIIYLHDIQSGESSTFTFDRFECNFDQLFVDGDRVLFVAQDKYSTEVDLYSFIPGEKCAKIGMGNYGQEKYYFIRDYHTIITTDHINGLIVLYNTLDGSKVKSIRSFKIEKNLLFDNGYFYVYHHNETNSLGSKYSYIDINLNKTDVRPDRLWCDLDIGDHSIEVLPIFASNNGRAAMILDRDGNISVALASVNSATKVIDYYAEHGFVTADGDIILYTLGGYGIILVNT